MSSRCCGRTGLDSGLDSDLGFGDVLCVVLVAGELLAPAAFLSDVAAGSGRAVSGGTAAMAARKRTPPDDR